MGQPINKIIMKNLIDLTLLEEFANGDPAFLEKMKSVFIKETIVNIEKIELNLAQNNLDTVSEIAHSIKPSLDYLAISDLRNQVRIVEKQEFTPESSKESISNFVSQLKELVNQLQ